MPPHARTAPSLIVHQSMVQLATRERFQFLDVTEQIGEHVRRSGVTVGQVTVQSLHTTAAVVVNENEPLLLEDFKTMLERLASSDAAYRHDDPRERDTHVVSGERANGHAHGRALVLGTSVTLNVQDGRPVLGRWQAIFLVELDGPRERSLSVSVLGQTS